MADRNDFLRTARAGPQAPARVHPLHALGALVGGAVFALRDARARALLPVPAALSGLVFVGFFAFGAPAFDFLQARVFGFGPFETGYGAVETALWTSFATGYFVAAVAAFAAVASLLAGPFLDRLSDRGQEKLVGSLPAVPARRVAERVRSGNGDFAGALQGCFRALAIAPVALLPGIGPPLALGAAAWSAGRAALGRSMARRGWDEERRAALLRAHAPAVLVFGLATIAAAAIPVVGALLAVPAASAGAPVLLERLDRSAAQDEETLSL